MQNILEQNNLQQLVNLDHLAQKLAFHLAQLHQGQELQPDAEIELEVPVRTGNPEDSLVSRYPFTLSAINDSQDPLDVAADLAGKGNMNNIFMSCSC